MDSRLYNIINNKSKYCDDIIKNNYSASYLNNTKWYKLIEALTNKFDEISMNVKLIYDDVIENHILNSPDFAPYFIEPIKYKEVEWIEFPNEYEYWINDNNLKAGTKLYKQNYQAIKLEIDKIGKFKIDEYDNKIRLYAYI